jgi:hypothetical protein
LLPLHPVSKDTSTASIGRTSSIDKKVSFAAKCYHDALLEAYTATSAT